MSTPHLSQKVPWEALLAVTPSFGNFSSVLASFLGLNYVFPQILQLSHRHMDGSAVGGSINGSSQRDDFYNPLFAFFKRQSKMIVIRHGKLCWFTSQSQGGEAVLRVHTKLLESSSLFAIVCTVACKVPLSMGFSRQEYWSGWPCPPPGRLPDRGTEPASPALAVGFFITNTTRLSFIPLFKQHRMEVLNPCVAELQEHGFRGGHTGFHTESATYNSLCDFHWLLSHAEPWCLHL